MNLTETGKIIASARKTAGYTQQALADELCVTDKAVSKWERGICLPDSALLTKLSLLLDTDIEFLISGSDPYGKNNWAGEIRANGLLYCVAGKPVIHYLLSYFMLVGISRISVLPEDYTAVKNMGLDRYGLEISESGEAHEKNMIVYDSFLLFGVNLTRQFQSCMNSEKNIHLTLHKNNVPILFSHDGSGMSMECNLCKAENKPLGRGTVYIPMDSLEGRKDAEQFISAYEKYNKKIADLEELSRLRRLIK